MMCIFQLAFQNIPCNFRFTFEPSFIFFCSVELKWTSYLSNKVNSQFLIYPLVDINK